MAVVIDGTTGVSAVQAGAVTTSDLPAGSVLQVVSVTTTLSFSSTSGTFASIGLAASITPTSATSKILVLASYTTDSQVSNLLFASALYRNASAVLTFNTQYSASGGYLATTPSINFLDSPATTSSTTYTVYGRIGAGAGTISCVQPSTITLMEMAA